MGTLKSVQFYNASFFSSNKCNQLIALIRNEMQTKKYLMQVQFNPFHMFTWKVVILLLPKKGTKWFGINNCDGLFFSTLHIGHITGGSVLWLMCNIPTLFHKATKSEVILSCG